MLRGGAKPEADRSDRCGFPAIDVVRDVDEVDEIVNRSAQQHLALAVLAAGADSAPVTAAL